MPCSSYALTKNVPAIEAMMPTAATASGSRTMAQACRPAPAYMKHAPRVIAAMIEPT